MRIIIVGAGASGITAAISLKRKHKDADILVIEHLDKALKKILATGNGKCNLGNNSIDISLYRNAEFVKPILEEYDFAKQKDFFESINIKTKLMGELLYPISESAVTVRNAMLAECEKLGIKIRLSEGVNAYNVTPNDIKVKTNSTIYSCDRLIFALGGKSSPNLGSDGSLFPLLEKHGYKFSKIKPGLCPIATKENTKVLDGVRVKGKVSLLSDGKLIHDESGEILFKSHGLSGIVIMNISRIIARDISKKYIIKIDQLEDEDIASLQNYLSKKGEESYLNAYFHPKMIEYIQRNKLDLIKASKELSFNFDELDSYEHSQVSVGGIVLDQINPDLSSKKEKGVYFIGELLDVDGPCGGYNLMWAFASALHLN